MNKLPLSIVSVMFAVLLAACASNDADVSAQLEDQSDRLSELGAQLADFSTSIEEMEAAVIEAEHDEMEGESTTNTFEVAVAQYVMDNAGFHVMDDELAETSTVDPAYASTVMRVARVIGSMEWPPELAERADHLIEVLADFHSALLEDDAEAAAPLASMAHDSQHDFSGTISAWLSGEMSVESEHEH